MAVTEADQRQFAKDFWGHFQQSTVAIIVLVQLLGLAATAIILYLIEMLIDNLAVSIIILASQAFIGSVVSVIIFRVVAHPFKDLVDAVVHVSGEPTASTPPNPNNQRYEKSGFKDVLQTIYQLAGEDEAKNPTVVAETGVSAQPITSNILELALSKTDCGFVVFDHNRSIIYSNKAAPVNIDQTGTSKLGLHFNGSDTLESWLDACEESSYHSEKVWTRVPDRAPEDEDRRYFDVIATYNKDIESEVILTLIDRTANYADDEEELNFIAFAAHELRGPITVIRGYLDVLQDEMKDVMKDDQQELFRRLTVSANRLSGYINNILNTSRYDRRHLKMHLVETTVADVYDSIRDDMALRASAQNRLLAVTIPTDLPTIASDPGSLGEVFSNLIDNAIKYSNEGGAINVTAAMRGELVEISFEDHGIGMPGNVLTNLFKKFYRSHRSRETVAGTGIGLYISKAIVESHGGTVSVRSEEGRGSTFLVSLPTYRSVADKLKAGDNSNEGLIGQGDGWITNHAMYRG